MNWLWARLKEPSTWAGLAVVLQTAAPFLAAGPAAPIIAGAMGVVAIIKKETGGD